MTSLYMAITNFRNDNAELLISKGADLNVTDSKGQTPLHCVAARGMKEIAAKMIANGAKKNVKDNEGKTPLNLASDSEHEEVVKLLTLKK